MEWEEINPNVWKPQLDGDSISGVLVLKEPRDVSKDLSARYFVNTKESGTQLVWGCTVLDDRMKFVDIGEVIRITFKGKVKNKKKQDVNLYKVEVAKI